MKSGYLIIFFLVGICSLHAQDKLSIVTDGTWRVSQNSVEFGTYPMPYEHFLSLKQSIAATDIPAYGTKTYQGSDVIPGTQAIWKSWRSSDEWETYAFLKKFYIPSGVDIANVKLSVSCDDAARVYINGKLVEGQNINRELSDKDGNNVLYRNLSAFLYEKRYDYELKDYLFTGVDNVIIVEVNNQPIYDNHGFLSLKLEADLYPQAIVKKDTPSKNKNNSTQPSQPTTTATPPNPQSPPVNNEFNAQVKTNLLKIGDVLELKDVYFNTDEWTLEKKSKENLMKLVEYLKSNPALKIEIAGHTNLLPADAYCDKLSSNRAKSVYDFLIEKGVKSDRLSYKGYGKKKPKINNKTPEANAKNQRVEIVIIEL